tara:strand:- start:375 stop:971 length:597 start_codon:yes stop_codon:yes gene_type:complete
MKRKQIVFTGVGCAELQEVAMLRAGDDDVLVANDVSAISAGTERACLLDLPNLGDEPQGCFPKTLGYSCVGRVIEVTGQSIAMKQALALTAPSGRIALLGCTRVSDASIDYYQDVHRPGIEMIGAHTMSRPKLESRPHSWTWRDDARAILDYMSDGRLDMSQIVSTLYSPLESSAVYAALAKNENFPVGAVFDWNQLK